MLPINAIIILNEVYALDAVLYTSDTQYCGCYLQQQLCFSFGHAVIRKLGISLKPV